MSWFGTDHNSNKKYKTTSQNKSGYTTTKGGAAMNLGVGKKRTRNIDDVINASVRGKKK